MNTISVQDLIIAVVLDENCFEQTVFIIDFDEVDGGFTKPVSSLVPVPITSLLAAV